jgi:catechol 2,3-dioxygenase-like lactoylglutathione lyase family enzyme
VTPIGDVGVVTTVMHDTADLDAAVEFWTRVLGLDVVHRDARYAYLSPVRGEGPHLAFQKVPESKAVKNRLHLDIRVPDRSTFRDLVLTLGGSAIGDHQEGDYPMWTVMADPEGNEFCIYEATGE